MNKGPKILFLDIETSPMEALVWDRWSFIPMDRIKKDWAVISWAAKWAGSKEIFQQDNRDRKNPRDDKTLLCPMWGLLDSADIIVTQNGKKFDVKKLNARFIVHELRPPSSYQHIDIYRIVKKQFGFTSNKLEDIAKVLKLPFKKLTDRKFQGMRLWDACLEGNRHAWNEMAKYNIRDVQVLEAAYKRVQPWDGAVNFNVYYGSKNAICACGGKDFRNNGFAYSKAGKYQRFECKACGSELRARQNLADKSLKVGVTR